MNTCKRHRFPSDILSYAVWQRYRFNLSHRDIEELLAERGIAVSRESIRLWCIKFGAIYTRRIKRVHMPLCPIFFNPGRHLVYADHYRNLREGEFSEWGGAAV